jgi:aspartate/methionine/tyrosine aminotransferase
MTLAEIALRPHKRARLLDRQREISRAGHAVMQAWVAKHANLVSLHTPQATSIAFVRYHVDQPALVVSETLRQRHSVLVAPGSALGAEGHLRVTVGYDTTSVATALDRLADVLQSLSASQ